MVEIDKQQKKTEVVRFYLILGNGAQSQCSVSFIFRYTYKLIRLHISVLNIC